MTEQQDGHGEVELDRQSVVITDSVSIPLSELEFRFSRGGGPGGQHVNRSATRVELLFQVTGSPSLSAEQQELVRSRLAGRIDEAGVLRVVAHSERSQLQNREEAVERFQLLLRRSLHVHKSRKRSDIPMWAKRRRLEEKRKRSEVKRTRRRVGRSED